MLVIRWRHHQSPGARILDGLDLQIDLIPSCLQPVRDRYKIQIAIPVVVGKSRHGATRHLRRPERHITQSKRPVGLLAPSLTRRPLIAHKNIQPAVPRKIHQSRTAPPRPSINQPGPLGHIFKFPRSHLTKQPVWTVLPHQKHIRPAIAIKVAHTHPRPVDQIVADILRLQRVLKI